MNKIISVIIFLSFSFSSYTQNIEFAREVIDTLTSNYFSGRGAVNEGEKKAAAYIKKQYQKIGLKSYTENYFQPFNFSINTFPDQVTVSLDKVKLITGVDFLVDAKSGGVNGTFDLVWYNKENVPTKKQLKKLVAINFFTNKFIIIDDAAVNKDDEVFQLLKINVFNAAGIILIEDKKLTHYLSDTYNDFAIIKIKRQAINRDYKSITVNIDQKRINNYQSQNVIGYVKGTEHPDSVIILSAHYDHLGMMGNEVFFPGANDNASGVAMLLNLAAYYTHKEPPTKTIVFMAFGAEEAGIIGSKYFVEHPLFELTKINFVVNLDLLGTGDDGAMIVNGAVFPQQYEMLHQKSFHHRTAHLMVYFVI